MFNSIKRNRRSINHSIIWLLTIAICLWPAAPSIAQGRPSYIRDAEIEATIRAYADPLFKAAGLDASFVGVYLIQNDEINAFVAGGQRLFIHTGLLIRASRPNQVIGVIAHETGHIIGGHLARIHDALRRATIESIIATVLGLGAAAAGAVAGNSGAVEAGAGAVSLGQSIALRNLLQYSQQQESSADQAGLKLLDMTEQSSRGLLEFFELLSGEEHLLAANQDPYLRTHPLTRSRIDTIGAHVRQSPYRDKADDPHFVQLHARMLAKLIGYLRPASEVARLYPKEDLSDSARYARAINAFRYSRLADALAEMDQLLAGHPKDPFYLEQKAQILYDNGRINEAIPLYEEAAQILPNESLLRFEAGQVLVESENDALLPQAIKHLEASSRLETANASTWRLLAIAYGRSGNLPMAELAQAEEAAAVGNVRRAKLFADRALKGLPFGSPASVRAQDILITLDNGEN